MKIVFAFILLLPVLSYGQAVDTVDVKILDFQGGLVHKSGKPFTGFGVASWGKGQKRSDGKYRDGKH